MKYTGLVRRVDELGRIVIPKELRLNLGIEGRDKIEIFVDNGKVVLKKYTNTNACALTGNISKDNKAFFDGKITLSPEAVQAISKELDLLLVDE